MNSILQLYLLSTFLIYYTYLLILITYYTLVSSFYFYFYFILATYTHNINWTLIIAVGDGPRFALLNDNYVASQMWFKIQQLYHLYLVDMYYKETIVNPDHQ